MRTLLTLATALFIAPVVQAQTGTVQNAQLRAHLFYDHTGGVSDNLIGNDDFALFNVIIGEGSATSPSQSTLVVLVLEGRPGSFGSGVATLTVRESDTGDVVTRQEANVGEFSERGQSYVMYAIQQTGCTGLDLEVQLDRTLGGQRLTGNLPFFCGE